MALLNSVVLRTETDVCNWMNDDRDDRDVKYYSAVQLTAHKYYTLNYMVRLGVKQITK